MTKKEGQYIPQNQKVIMSDILLKLNKTIVFLLFMTIQFELSYAQSSEIQKQNITQSKGELFQKNILYVIPEDDDYNGLSNTNKSFCIPIDKGIQGSTSDNVSTYEQESIAWHTHSFYGVSNQTSFVPTLKRNIFDSNFINLLKLDEQIQEIQGFTPNLNKRGYLNIKLKTDKKINISLNGDVMSWYEHGKPWEANRKYVVDNKIPYIYYAIDGPYHPVQKQILVNDHYGLKPLENVRSLFFLPFTKLQTSGYSTKNFSIPSITHEQTNTHIICKK